MGGPAIVNGKDIPELDNFYQCKFELDNYCWNDAETYFQANKTQDLHLFTKIRLSVSPSAAWKLGNEIPLRKDWEDIKVGIMYKANDAKFRQNPELKKILVSTGLHDITFTGSTPFWNKENAKILERLRMIFLTYTESQQTHRLMNKGRQS